MTHDPCCSSHGVTMDCARYRRTHFVEVRPCCSADTRTSSYALEIAEHDYHLRETAKACGFDAEKAVARAQEMWRETLLGPVTAMDRVRAELLNEWARG